MDYGSLKFLRCKTTCPCPQAWWWGCEGDDGPGGGAATAPVVPHEGLVVPDELIGVGKLPAEVRTLLEKTAGAERILQVRIHLNLLTELLALDLHESRGHSLHVGLGAVEGDPPAADGVLVLVGVNTCVDDSTEQVVEDVGEALCIKHSMKSTNEDCLLRVQPLVGASDKVAVTQHPGDDLHLLTPHPPAGDLVVPRPSIGIVMGALSEEQGDVLFLLENYVDITLGWRWRSVLARPLNADGPKVSKSLDEAALRDIPGNTTQEYLAGKDRVLVSPGRESAGPGAGGLVVAGGGAVLRGSPLQAGGGGDHRRLVPLVEHRVCSHLRRRRRHA